ncbi:hypothetical protein EYF80_033625 [Liparis tanakae]|uniref:Uncharacterized protein n=1 Tax=Liparis tanakae TaxID=230148 RepID=A0A4Z2GSD8_9TELE|nr:hypothetical protein EYF80_033625 [Liparis tanakae]
MTKLQKEYSSGGKAFTHSQPSSVPYTQVRTYSFLPFSVSSNGSVRPPKMITDGRVLERFRGECLPSPGNLHSLSSSSDS